MINVAHLQQVIEGLAGMPCTITRHPERDEYTLRFHPPLRADTVKPKSQCAYCGRARDIDAPCEACGGPPT